MRTDQGKLVEVCTLDGFKTVAVDDQGHIKEESMRDADRSAAVALSDLMAEATSDIAVIPFIEEAPPVYVISYSGQPTVLNSARTLKPIRAPPLLMV